ncbi:MAG: hypothetical protein ACKPKO_14225, partial [Candidatus Fonsibacter sp.]
GRQSVFRLWVSTTVCPFFVSANLLLVSAFSITSRAVPLVADCVPFRQQSNRCMMCKQRSPEKRIVGEITAALVFVGLRKAIN